MPRGLLQTPGQSSSLRRRGSGHRSYALGTVGAVLWRTASVSPACPLPANTTAFLAWMVLDLCQTVAAQNFQPYLSAVNKAHEHLELQKPAVGERVSATRRSIAADAVKLVVEPQRIRVSADVIADALDEAVNDPDAPDELVRATVAVVIDSVCCSRGDTGVGIKGNL